MKFQKKPVIVDAVQWFKLGDHPLVLDYHHAYDQGFRYTTCDGGVCSVNNNYTGCGVIFIEGEWIKVYPSNFIVELDSDIVVMTKQDFLDEFEPMAG